MLQFQQKREWYNSYLKEEKLRKKLVTISVTYLTVVDDAVFELNMSERKKRSDLLTQ